MALFKCYKRVNKCQESHTDLYKPFDEFYLTIKSFAVNEDGSDLLKDNKLTSRID